VNGAQRSDRRRLERGALRPAEQGRGNRLKSAPELFSGLVWTGQKSIELGLADALGSVEYVARDVIKAEQVVDFTPKENIAERFARRFGSASAEALLRAASSHSVR